MPPSSRPTRSRTSGRPRARRIKAAKAAADAGKFDEAVAHAQQAEALANGSIAQAKEQEKLWPDAVIR